jgi:predicted kinase
MAGTPLSGKTTLAKEILNSASEATILIENDEIRKQVALENGDSEPKYTDKESTRTFSVSRELIRIGLSNKCNVIFDATNLNERSRRGTYEAALQKNTAIEVLIVKANDTAVEERYRTASKEQQAAYNKLGDKQVSKVMKGIQSITVDSGEPPKEMLKKIGKNLIIPVNKHG